MRIRAGELNQRISITGEVRVKDAFGGTAVTPLPLGDFWAKVRPSSAREIPQAGRTQGRTLYTVIIRRPAALAVTTDMRIAWQGQSLDIRGILDEGPQDAFLRIVAEAGVPHPAGA